VTKVLIVDDEPIARRGLRSILELEPAVEIVGEARDGKEAVTLIQNLKPDIVLLDIRMPDMDGFEVVQTIGLSRMPATIFVTAFDEHALQAFDAHAVDYVLKPVDAERLLKSFRRARALVGANSKTALASLLGTVDGSEFSAERIVVRDRGRIFFLKSTDIESLKADGNYVVLTVGQQIFYHREPLSRLLKRVRPGVFVQISRSAALNLEFIESMKVRAKGSFTIRMKSGILFNSSRHFRDRLDKFLR
jgi:two-component system, LytTR family, response regulator